MRADVWLVENGHYDSRARAQAAIKAGLVKIDGKTVKKASFTVNKTAKVEADHEHPWVSRGGLKLVHALAEFGVDPGGKTCLDVGSSTGGFTEVLLSHHAAKVYAVDVGTGQLHRKLRGHPKIVSLESQDARDLTANHIPVPPDLIVCDASFISAMKILGVPLALAAKGANLVTLVKPQFEVGKINIGRGGLVKSEAVGLQALADVSDWVTRQGWTVIATTTSPITGGSGNTEYLLHGRKG